MTRKLTKHKGETGLYSLDEPLEKLKKGVVAYFMPESIGSPLGARCGICMMFVDGRCTVVEGNINGVHGVCDLYVHGKHSGPVMKGMLSKDEAGYVETGPTHCASCEYFEAPFSCQKVEGKVEGEGCCNAYEPQEKESVE